MTLSFQNIGKKHAPPVQYRFTNKNRPGLDKNHTHFILVDDGTTGKYGREIKLRSQFEAMIAKQNVITSSAAGKSSYIRLEYTKKIQYNCKTQISKNYCQFEIEKYILCHFFSFKGKVDVPVVVLCLEGGPNTIRTMSEAINNNTPLVVIGGTGRSADVVCYAYQHLDRYFSALLCETFTTCITVLVLTGINLRSCSAFVN